LIDGGKTLDGIYSAQWWIKAGLTYVGIDVGCQYGTDGVQTHVVTGVGMTRVDGTVWTTLIGQKLGRLVQSTM
jgi:hypothetical protein